jgi:hypothetical protein
MYRSYQYGSSEQKTQPRHLSIPQNPQPGLLTGYLLRAVNGSHLSFFSQIALLNVVRLRLRRSIREKPNI